MKSNSSIAIQCAHRLFSRVVKRTENIAAFLSESSYYSPIHEKVQSKINTHTQNLVQLIGNAYAQIPIKIVLMLHVVRLLIAENKIITQD